MGEALGIPGPDREQPDPETVTPTIYTEDSQRTGQWSPVLEITVGG